MRQINIPNKFSFITKDGDNFDSVFNTFDWNVPNGETVCINFKDAIFGSYQALTLIVQYVYFLKSKGCFVKFLLDDSKSDNISGMWKRIGGKFVIGAIRNPNPNIASSYYKPLFLVRDSSDFKKVLEGVKDFVGGFGVNYEKTIRYIISELLYNANEHGISRWKIGATPIPTLFQASWYAKRNEIQFIVSDLGIGIKKHLEQNHPIFDSAADAICESLKPKVSGTFGKSSIYTNNNNAGMGLYISNSITRRTNSNMYIMSGNGFVHISPTDITKKTLNCEWPGTWVMVQIKANRFDYDMIMSEIKNDAEKEIREQDMRQNAVEFCLDMENYFGVYAEVKEDAIKFKEKYLIGAANKGQTIKINFDRIINCPHSFLNALLGDPIKIFIRSGFNPYKKIKIFNCATEIRETIDYIFDDITN